MDSPEPIKPFCSAFLNGLITVLQDNLFAVYLYGAWTFPESRATGDVDLHVILAGPLSDDEKSGIFGLHNALAQEFPALAGDGPDAYYILLADARKSAPPRHQLSETMVDASWALHRAHMLAGRCIVLYGPDPSELFLMPSWEELDVALQAELDFVARHLTEYPAYCILNLCRLIYSYQTQDVVVSKYRSAIWAGQAFPEKRAIIEAALKVYDVSASGAEKHLVASEVACFYVLAYSHNIICKPIKCINPLIQE